MIPVKTRTPFCESITAEHESTAVAVVAILGSSFFEPALLVYGRSRFVEGQPDFEASGVSHFETSMSIKILILIKIFVMLLILKGLHLNSSGSNWI
jgi:hypothetical protein